jgi:hypothetical protein
MAEISWIAITNYRKMLSQLQSSVSNSRSSDGASPWRSDCCSIERRDTKEWSKWISYFITMWETHLYTGWRGVLGRHLFPNRHLLGGIPPIHNWSHILFPNTPPWSICHLYIAIQRLLLKNPVGKIEEKYYNDMPPKTPLKPSGKN